MRRVTVAGLAVAIAALVGCGGGPKFAPVSGRVTLNNQPLAGVSVDFQPISPGKGVDPGPGSTGITDEDGRYTLHSQLDPSQAGAVVGKHQVRIWTPAADEGRDADAGPKKKSAVPMIPGRYHVQSELTFDVPAGGTDAANFDLKSP